MIILDVMSLSKEVQKELTDEGICLAGSAIKDIRWGHLQSSGGTGTRLGGRRGSGGWKLLKQGVDQLLELSNLMLQLRGGGGSGG